MNILDINAKIIIAVSLALIAYALINAFVLKSTPKVSKK
ncbi:MAG: hypothetical protein ACD_19C00014G0035 [uncultured bacterium]|nr:MAG: hypothetical protein ACD_19C00014G0035 [uncultured bacterium]